MREMTGLYWMQKEKKHREMQVVENTLNTDSGSQKQDTNTCFYMHFPISKKNNGLKAGMLRNTAFDTYWYEF